MRTSLGSGTRSKPKKLSRKEVIEFNLPVNYSNYRWEIIQVSPKTQPFFGPSLKPATQRAITKHALTVRTVKGAKHNWVSGEVYKIKLVLVNQNGESAIETWVKFT